MDRNLEKFDINKKTIIDKAAKTALIFGAVSVLYLVWGFLLDPNASTVLYQIVGLAKIVGLIILMRKCMQNLKDSYNNVSARELKQYGKYIALFSSVIVAVSTFVCLQFIFPDYVKTVMDLAYAQMGSMLDSNSITLLQEMENKMASYQCVGSLIWCYLYGYILSCILAPRIAPKNIFNED